MKENQNNGTCLSMKTCLVRLEMDLSLVVEQRKKKNGNKTNKNNNN